MRFNFRSILFWLLLSQATASFGTARQFFIVTRTAVPLQFPEKISLAIPWPELTLRLPGIQSGDFKVTNRNFGTLAGRRVLDGNGDGRPDQVVLDITFESNEPVYAFLLETTGEPLVVAEGTATSDPHHNITFLEPFDAEQMKESSLNWTDAILKTARALYPDPKVLRVSSTDPWSHERAFFLHAMLLRWEQTREPWILSYARTWVDRFLDSHGAINPRYYRVERYQIEDILPGRLLIFLYDHTGDEKYKNAATQLKTQLMYQPRTGDRGYWHKQANPYQMWIEGSYMAAVFAAQYGAAFNEPVMTNEAITQVALLYEHCLDGSTGLMYHGWDESGGALWADPDRGTSPEFWSRAMGWYMMALVECLEHVPEKHPRRKELTRMFQGLAASLVKYQDKESRLWFQVTNRGQESSNWIETSSSAMIVGAFAKGHRLGLLHKTYDDAARSAFERLVKGYVYADGEGRVYMDGAVKTGSLDPADAKVDYNYYVTVERRINDCTGLGALLYASLELGRR